MSKTTLKDRHKRFLVQSLACFMSPTEAVEAVKEEFKEDFTGLTITRQAVEAYDPTKVAGVDLSDKLKELFFKTREEYIAGTESFGIAHKSYRIEQLNRMEKEARRMRSFSLAAQLHEQAAREMGGAFTNKREHTGKDGAPLPTTSATVIILPDNGRNHTNGKPDSSGD